MKQKDKETYQKLRKQQKRLTLRTRLTITIAFIVLISILASMGIAWLLVTVFPALRNVPEIIQLNVLSLIIASVLGRLAVSVFTDPVGKLREGMQKVADGDFDVHLDTKSSSKEIQELIAGFNMMTQELRSTEILQSDFVSNVSHEFKTPITAIEGYTTLLQRTDNIDEVENAYIEKILFNTRRLSSLVSNILLLSKIESQAVRPDRKEYDLDEQIRTVLLDMEAAWEPKELDFDVELESISYLGDEIRMYHVWSNLLSNAIKFSPHGGQIKLRLSQKDGTIRFTVDDQGPGLSDEAQKHLFDKFYQADSSREQEGNGLGLALVKNILDLYGGQVEAENLPQGGCRFTVVLHAE